MEMDKLVERIEKIEKRNSRVEDDKAWETSGERKALLILFTYLSIGAYMWAIGVGNPWLNAVVPSIGFLLSTLTLPWFKDWWLKRRLVNKVSKL